MNVSKLPAQTQSQLATLNANWLETSNGIDWYQAYPTPIYNNSWTFSSLGKIRLKLSEIERLRLAAKDDAKLKKILSKFTSHIEIEVDFD